MTATGAVSDSPRRRETRLEHALTSRKSSPSRDRSPLWPLVAALFAGAVDMQICAPLLNIISRDLGVEPSNASIFVTAYALASAIAAPLAAPYAARIGALRMMIQGLWLLAVGTFGCALAPTAALLTLGRAIAGVGGGITLTMCHVYVAQEVSYEERGRALGWLGSGFFAATILGIPLGAFLADHVDWRWTFALLAFVTAAVIPLVTRLPHGISGIPFRFADYRHLAHDRGAIPALAAFGLFAAGFMTVLTYFGVWLERAFGLATSSVGLVFMLGGISALMGGPIGGRLADRFGKKPVALAANALMAVMLFALPGFNTLAGVIAGFCGAYLAASCRFPAMMAILTETVPADRRGPLLLANHTAILLGTGLGSYLGGIAYAARGFTAVGHAAGAVTFAVLFLIVILPDPSGVISVEPPTEAL
jgi:predicted MFS family arabinose efflux permease